MLEHIIATSHSVRLSTVRHNHDPALKHPAWASVFRTHLT